MGRDTRDPPSIYVLERIASWELMSTPSSRSGAQTWLLGTIAGQRVNSSRTASAATRFPSPFPRAAASVRPPRRSDAADAGSDQGPRREEVRMTAVACGRARG